MVSIRNSQTDRNRRQDRNTVLIALAVALAGAMAMFVPALGNSALPKVQVWSAGGLAAMAGVLLILISLGRSGTTGRTTGLLTVYLVVHLNAAAMLVYVASPDIVRILPYICWFFPLVLIHRFTNTGFFLRPIGLVVNLSPVPIAVFVTGIGLDQPGIPDLGAIITFMACFLAFVMLVEFYARRRDAEIWCAACAEEAGRSADLMRLGDERFRLIGRATNDLVWDADLKSGKIWWNDILLTIYGYDPKDLHTDMTAWDSWIHPEDRNRVASGLRSVMDSGASNWTSEYRFVCADGRIVDVVDRGLVLRDAEGQPIRMIGSTADVTELRNLEKKLLHAQKLEAVGQLTGGIAHDFNNLLTIIVGNVESLASIGSDPKVRRMAEITLQAAERAATLTSRLLSFSRKQVLSPQPIDPGLLLTGIEGLIRRTINESIDIRINATTTLWQIEADQSQLENAVLNLVINARDAMPDGGHLTIDASNVTPDEDDLHLMAGDYVAITVSDTGCGMPQDVIERAFEPFFTTKEVGMGSGLGLSMVWGFVQQSKGHVQICSNPGDGTSVKLFFPASTSAVVTETKHKDDPALLTGSERILVVEDDAMVRKYVVTQLLSLGYQVTDRESAELALAVLDCGESFDLLFTDVVMPGMNGGELAAEALQRQPDLKVLFTSGYTEDVILHKGRLADGVSLLSKPYRRADLALAIRQSLDSRAPGRVVLDPDAS